MKNSLKFLGALALGGIGFAGCSGGSSNTPTSTNGGLGATTAVAVTADNRIHSFAVRSPLLSTSQNINGIAAGQTIVGLDYRFPAPSGVAGNGATGLYGLGKNGTTHQLYRIDLTPTSANATAVGSPFTLSPQAEAFGFDFNPTVDRIRVVEPTQNRNLRLNPNTGEVVDDPAIAGPFDGTLTFAATDSNAGRDPNIVAAAYTNVDADPATGTVNYALDLTTNSLVTQGRPASGATPAVSPNTGQLFTVARISSVTLTPNTNFDIESTSTQGVVSVGARIYGLNLTTGALSGGESIRTVSPVNALAIVPQTVILP